LCRQILEALFVVVYRIFFFSDLHLLKENHDLKLCDSFQILLGTQACFFMEDQCVKVELLYSPSMADLGKEPTKIHQKRDIGDFCALKW